MSYHVMSVGHMCVYFMEFYSIWHNRPCILYKFQTRMFECKNNFRKKYKDSLCPLCLKEDDTQEHLFKCDVLHDTTPEEDLPYDDIFSKDEDKLYKIILYIQDLISKRDLTIQRRTQHIILHAFYNVCKNYIGNTYIYVVVRLVENCFYPNFAPVSQ